MIGRVLGNRYQIIEKIGNGGMAEVYAARCQILKRQVAVKILRSEYANDEEFIGRFNTESLAAASLSHPNIVSIYDTGSDGEDIHYIVMELVEGQTLKEYIDKNKPLDWAESVDFARQICRALEHAHANGIVHRDIKPHNIMVTGNNMLKVMDFGIARAASGATVSMSGSTIGSVHYFSPEQARGGYVDEKSDLYSVGIVMYEMLTGSLPFDGDTPVAVAIKQIQEAPLSPVNLNPDIPPEIEEVVMRAIAKDPSRRFESATQMLREIEETRRSAPVREALDLAETRKMDTLDYELAIKRKPKHKEEISEEEKKANKRMSMVAAGAAVLVFLMVALGMTYLIAPGIFDGRVMKEVPNLVGRDIDEVYSEYQNPKEFTVRVVLREDTDDVPLNHIIRQSPSTGTTVVVPYTIEVVVSSGTRIKTLDNYVEKDEREVKIALENMGLTVKVEQESNDQIPQGFIIRTKPAAGAQVKPGDEITLYVSRGGAKEVPMISLIGMSLDDAKRVLTQYNLELGTVTQQESPRAANEVIAQSVEVNKQVKEFTKINLVIAIPQATAAPATAAPVATQAPANPTAAPKPTAAPAPTSSQ